MSWLTDEPEDRSLGLDTDVLVHWTMAGAPHHRSVRRFLDREARQGHRLALTQQTLNEHLHIVTDPRRFEHPLPMAKAIHLSRELWHSESVKPILPTEEVHDLVCELMEQYRLGRKRILDTALAATLKTAGISALATLNRRDFKIFPFLEVVDPARDGVGG